MTNRVKLKLQIQEHALSIPADTGQVFHQSLNFFRGSRRRGEQGRQLRPVALYVLLENRTKNIFFVLEVVVKRATRLSRIRCNIF